MVRDGHELDAPGVGTSGRLTLAARLPAPVYTLSSLALLVLIVPALNFGAARPDELSQRFVTTTAWLAWRATAAVAMVVFLGLLIYGVRLLRRSLPEVLPASQKRTGLYLAIPTLMVVVAVVLIVTTGGRNPDIPVHHLAWRTRAVLFLGLASVVPWIAVAWLCQDRCRPQVNRPWNDGSEVLDYQQLVELWRVVVACIGSFSAGVTSAVLTAGALRFAFLAARPECSPDYDPTKVPAGTPGCSQDFPATDVLLYGAAFAVIGLAIALPLIWSWRTCAVQWLAAQKPTGSTDFGKDWVDERSRLASLLHLDTPILRNPLTVLSVFTPLITSALAAFLPQLGS